jgi:hypothetical protein
MYIRRCWKSSVSLVEHQARAIACGPSDAGSIQVIDGPVNCQGRRAFSPAQDRRERWEIKACDKSRIYERDDVAHHQPDSVTT